MRSTNDGSQIDGQRLPLFPAASTRHIYGAKKLPSEAVDAYLYLTATQTTGHTGCKRTGHLITKCHILKLDIVTIVNITDINTYLVILFRLHTTRESHRLSLNTTEGVEDVNRLHALVCRHDGGKRAVGVILEFLNSHTATEAATLRQLACMIEEIGVALIVSNTTMISK